MEEKVKIRCMLLPLTEEYLMLPNVCVAEVIGHSDSVLNNNSEGYHLGKFEWRGVTIPLISFENACGLKNKNDVEKDRVAVIYHPDGDKDKPYLGIQLIDIPQTFIAEEESLDQQNNADKNTPLIENKFIKDDKTLLIPNLDALFELI